MRVLTLLLMSMLATDAFAQSLGEVARREAERRKNVKAPGKVYTNEVLKAEPLPSSIPASPGAPGDAAAPAAPPATGAPQAGAPPANAPAATTAPQGNDEKSWKGRIQAAREALSRAELFAQSLQSRINGLSTDFTSRDDPAQRQVIGADRQKALDELARVQKEVQQHTKAVADIQEEGRRAGVPAGWLR